MKTENKKANSKYELFPHQTWNFPVFHVFNA